MGLNIFCTIQTQGKEGTDKADVRGKNNGFYFRDTNSEPETRETKINICASDRIQGLQHGHYSLRSWSEV